MIRKILIYIKAACFLILISATFVFASTINKDVHGVAIKGYDPVAYFTDQNPTMGESTFQYKWQDATWYFTSEDHKRLFVSNPEKYAPEFGGYCAYGVSKGSKADIDPTAWSIVDNKLYLNFNESVQAIWKKNSVEYIRVANQNWPKIK